MNHDESRLLFGRRDLLAGFGTAVAGMAVLQDSVAEENNPRSRRC